MRLSQSFFERPTLTVAQALIGCRLVYDYGGSRLAGIITETEAYIGEDDLACHAKAGKTARTAPMYAEAGTIYIYLIYGMYWCLNIVTERVGFPSAVLLRGFLPTENTDLIYQNRKGKKDTFGPGKLTQALGIDNSLNGLNMFAATPCALWIEAPLREIDPKLIVSSPRIGIDRVPEPWRSLPWRFHIPLPVLYEVLR